MADILPAEGTPFGDRVRKRLRSDYLIWFTTVGADGTPQPNPVWFVWEGDTVLTFNTPNAHRLVHIRHRPRVALNFDSASGGDDIVVLKGSAWRSDEDPGPLDNPAFLEKYRTGMVRVTGSPEAFAEAYSVPVRIRIEKARGF